MQKMENISGRNADGDGPEDWGKTMEI